MTERRPHFVKQEQLSNTDHKFRQTDAHLVARDKHRIHNAAPEETPAPPPSIRTRKPMRHDPRDERDPGR